MEQYSQHIESTTNTTPTVSDSLSKLFEFNRKTAPLDEIHTLWMSAFNNEEHKFFRWLSKVNWQTEPVTPFDLITKWEYETILELLHKIDRGDFGA